MLVDHVDDACEPRMHRYLQLQRPQQGLHLFLREQNEHLKYHSLFGHQIVEKLGYYRNYINIYSMIRVVGNVTFVADWLGLLP
jgi:hypothetical protein